MFQAKTFIKTGGLAAGIVGVSSLTSRATSDSTSEKLDTIIAVSQDLSMFTGIICYIKILYSYY